MKKHLLRQICVSIVFLYSCATNAILVEVEFHGVVTVSNTSQFDAGDSFSWTLRYEILPTGECPNRADASNPVLYRCQDTVTSSSATIGGTIFSGAPVYIPALDRSSSLQVSDGDSLGFEDQFQGSVNFDASAGIQFPVLAFYLKDSSSSSFTSPPRIPTAWQDSDLLDFDSRKISLFNYGSGGAERLLDGEIGPPLIDLRGVIKTADGSDICAMVLASGQFMFSCDPVGLFSLVNLPRDDVGTVKRQVYADGFLPKIDELMVSSTDAVIMTRSGNCPSYNPPDDPGVFPDSAGKRINIAGKVFLQNSQTPICAMVLANGQYMFSCDGSGGYALNIPLDNNGQFKLQVYADGFAPSIQDFDEFQAVNDVRMARATECQ